MKIATFLCALITAGGIWSAALAGEFPRASRPEEVGLSTARLKRLTDAFEADVQKGAIPGAMILIARQGKIAYFHPCGFLDREKQVPMTSDAIFRIASMTKPIVSVAVMMLVEEGKLQIAYPIDRYLPELKGLKVGTEKLDPVSGQLSLVLEPAQREITVQDLLRHTSGITYGQFGNSLVQQAYNAAKMMDLEQTNAEMVTKLSKLPLRYQPGSTFEYGMSVDVLGRLVEVLSEMDLQRFLKERICQPLGMPDTDFVVPVENARRIAEPQVDKGTGKRPPIARGDLTVAPKWFSGGGGMVSTASDYARFCQMLLNGGELDGVRLLSRKTIELMTSQHLPPGVGYGSYTPSLGLAAPTPEMGYGFGLGFAVRMEPGRNPHPGSVGDFGWGGAYGTYFWVDPREKLIAILMLQAPVERRHYRSLLRDLVYQAVVE